MASVAVFHEQKIIIHALVKKCDRSEENILQIQWTYVRYLHMTIANVSLGANYHTLGIRDKDQSDKNALCFSDEKC